MELPAYHVPRLKGVIIHMWDRTKSFVKKAGTIIFLACGVIWFLSSFNWSMDMVDTPESMLASIGARHCAALHPLGWGDWQSAVAAITGLVAKENVVGTFGVLFGFAEVAEDGMEVWASLQGIFTPLSAFSFLIFNLLCAPCFAAIGAIRREMGSGKLTWFAIGYQTVLAYAVSFTVYRLGLPLYRRRVYICHGSGYYRGLDILLLPAASYTEIAGARFVKKIRGWRLNGISIHHYHSDSRRTVFFGAFTKLRRDKKQGKGCPNQCSHCAHCARNTVHAIIMRTIQNANTSEPL